MTLRCCVVHAESTYKSSFLIVKSPEETEAHGVAQMVKGIDKIIPVPQPPPEPESWRRFRHSRGGRSTRSPERSPG